MHDISDDERDMVRAVRSWVDKEVKPVVQELEHANTYPEALIEGMKEMGIFGLMIPEEYGGLGESLLTYALTVEQIARCWMSVSGIINTHFIVAWMLLQHGTEEQRRRYLPRMATGEVRGAFSMSEPGCGSDVSGIKTRAVPDSDGAGGWTINGQKMWLTNGGSANLVAVLCRTDEGQPADSPPHRSMSTFLIEKEPGFGPNTRTLMQFQVVNRTGAADPAAMNLLETLAVNGAATIGNLGNNLLPKLEKLESRKAVHVRDLTLNETFDDAGRLIQMLGTNKVQNTAPDGTLQFGMPYDAESSEVVRRGTTEVWRIFNTTGDTHPMHFHLVNVQVLSRQPFNVAGYDGTPEFTGPARLPDANELGWKETVRMNPGECTTIIMRFDVPNVPYKVPVSPRTGGYEYVWHCHILEHEEHDMMRPLIVMP